MNALPRIDMSSSSIWSSPAYLSAKVNFVETGARPRFHIQVRQLPEGVFLATSTDIPGLVLECDTFDEIVDEIKSWAPTIAQENGIIPVGATPTFVIVQNNLSMPF